MKKILLGLGVITFIAAVVASATGAFFSDTETSTGNTFTAGNIDLTVDSEQHYNGNECVEVTAGIYQWQGVSPYPVPGSPCDGTWSATDLGAQKFFNFADVKPGDEGENTISLHVDSNDAFACIDVDITTNDDVSTNEPELDAGDTVENPGDTFDGELANNLDFFAWADSGGTPGFQGASDVTEGDNIWQTGELPLFSNISGPASDILGGKSYTLADSNTGPLPGGITNYIGLAWCAGTLTIGAPGIIACDGEDMGNDTQTDEMTANIIFRVEQARNNEDFECEPTPEGPIPQFVIVRENNLGIWQLRNFDAIDSSDDTSITTSGTDGYFIAGSAVPPSGTGSFQQDMGTNGDDAQRVMTSEYNGDPLSSFTNLSYSTYVQTSGSGGQASYIQLRIDKNGDGTTDDILFFEPVYQNGTYGQLLYATTTIPNQCLIPACVDFATWQTWDADAGGWWSNVDSAGGPPLTTLVAYAAEYPGAKLATDAPAFRITVGFGGAAWQNYVGDFDQLIVNEVTYDFENIPNP